MNEYKSNQNKKIKTIIDKYIRMINIEDENELKSEGWG